MLFGILGWVALGLVIGFIVSKSVNLRGDDPRLGIAVGGAGALVGGWLYSWISGSAVVAFNVWALSVAAVTALVMLAVWHFLRSRGKYAIPTVRRSY